MNFISKFKFFFTSIHYSDNFQKTNEQKLLEKVDDYFFLKGKVAEVEPNSIQKEIENVCIVPQANFSFFKTALKVASYFTIVIPLIVFVAKVILRSRHNYNVIIKIASSIS